MKSSIYNIYKKGKNGYVLLNTFASSVVYIDDETKHFLEENPDRIPEDILKMLFENGFVVEDSCDEKKVLAYHIDRDKYNVLPRDLDYTVVMTYACNLSCPYCCQGLNKDTETLDTKRTDILLKNIEKNLNKKDFKALGISLYGGEPLLAYHQCVKLMEGAFRICDEQNKGFRGDIVTNGVLINEDVIENLLKPYCGKVQITMDGGREIHDRRKRRKDGGGTYDTLLDVLELLRDAKIKTNLRLNIDKENADSFTELCRDLKDRGLEDIRRYLGWIFSYETGEEMEGCVSCAGKYFSSDEILEIEDQVSEQLGVKRVSDELLLPVTLRHEPCPFDREDNYVVDPYLDIYSCKEFIGFKDKIVGHIDENGETILNYEYYEQLSRDPLTFEECKDCKYLPFCAGGCARRAYHETGTYHSSHCGGHTYSLQKLMDKGMDNLTRRLVLSVSGEKA